MGIFCGFLAAFFNSIGYLFNARFLKRYNEEGRLLTYGMVGMLILALPFTPFLFPFTSLQEPGLFALKVIGWVAVFMIGQFSFFTGLRYFEASRLSSLLGLKIIVLALIFTIYNRSNLLVTQWIAIFVSAISAVMFNWSGAGRQKPLGWLFLLITLVMYSSCDILETSMVQHVSRCGLNDLQSSFAVVSIIYPVLGLVAMPGMLKYKPSKDQFALALPYSAVWVASQLALLYCFAKVLPVFGNVILATRGVFSVLMGLSLPLFGLASLDSNVSKRKWIQRIIAAILMVFAIGLYSWK